MVEIKIGFLSVYHRLNQPYLFTRKIGLLRKVSSFRVNSDQGGGFSVKKNSPHRAQFRRWLGAGFHRANDHAATARLHRVVGAPK